MSTYALMHSIALSDNAAKCLLLSMDVSGVEKCLKSIYDHTGPVLCESLEGEVMQVMRRFQEANFEGVR